MTATAMTNAPDNKALTAVARGGSLNLLGSVCTAIATFALALVLTRELGAGGAGPYFVAIPIFQILVRCAELGVSTGLIRAISQARVLNRTKEIGSLVAIGVTASFVAGLALMAIGLSAVGPIADLVTMSDSGSELIREILPVFLLGLPLATVFFALVNGSRGFGTMKPTALLDRMVRPIAQLILVAAAIAADQSARIIAIAWVLPYVVLAVAGAIWFARLTTRAIRRDPDAAERRPLGTISREFWAFTLPRAVAAVFQGASLWLNPIMVSALAGAAGAAIYTAGYRYLQLGTFLALAVGQSVQPLISEAMARSAISDAQGLFETTSSWLTAFVTPLYMSVAVFAAPLLSIFGPEFVEARWALVALSVAAMFSAICGPVDTVLLMGGRSVLSTYNMAVGFATNVVLNLLLIPRFGITGAGIAFGAGMVVMNLAPLIQVKRHLSLSPFGDGTRIAAVAAVGTFLPALIVGRIAAGESLLAAIGVSALAAAVYAPFVWRSRAELHLDEFASIVGRRSKKRPPTNPPTDGTPKGGTGDYSTKAPIGAAVSNPSNRSIAADRVLVLGL